MLYDNHGRRLRRAIGFLSEYRVEVDDAKHAGELVEAIGADWVDEDGDDEVLELEL